MSSIRPKIGLMLDFYPDNAVDFVKAARNLGFSKFCLNSDQCRGTGAPYSQSIDHTQLDALIFRVPYPIDSESTRSIWQQFSRRALEVAASGFSILLPYLPDRLEQLGLLISRIQGLPQGRIENESAHRRTVISELPACTSSLNGFIHKVCVVIPVMSADGYVPTAAAALVRNSVSLKEGHQSQEHRWWQLLKQMVGKSVNLELALELHLRFPAGPSVINEIEEKLLVWLGEPVSHIFLKVHESVHKRGVSGLLDPKFLPLLEWISKRFEATLFLPATGISQLKDTDSLRLLSELMRRIASSSNVDPTPKTRIFPPIQPLHHDLGQDSYDHFELDERKYADYKDALQQFFRLRKEQHSSLVVVVPGCGRGPLVTCAIEAAQTCKVDLKIFALEKNAAVVPELRKNCESIWTGWNVSIVMDDMRTWVPPQSIDVLVYELLGSFGDNELAPECLENIERYVKADGVCIPSRYTSFLCPVSIPKVYDLVVAYGNHDLLESVVAFELDHYLSLDAAKPVFTFEHPRTTSSESECTLHATLNFTSRCCAVLHGFAGFFEAELFGELRHSLLPDRRTPGLSTWPDILFPLRDPIFVDNGDVIVLEFWRKRDHRSVWYEWQVIRPVRSQVHNFAGHCYRMPLEFAPTPTE